ncbi:Photosystem II PsbX [Sesbania bispinosa]|nr:Photosystem II PsbX [Sesbania bispinosa]
MASASVAMALPLSSATQNRLNKPSSEAFFNPLPLRQSKRTLFTKAQSKSKLGIHASLKEKALTGITAASLTASMVIPEVAQAAGSDLTPSLKNFLLSIFAGGVVLAALLGAVIGVSNFDPVKRT